MNKAKQQPRDEDIFFEMEEEEREPVVEMMKVWGVSRNVDTS